MRISRHGSGRDHGEDAVTFDRPQLRWDPKLKQLEVRAKNVLDFSTASKHDYRIAIAADEIKAMFAAIVDDANGEG